MKLHLPVLLRKALLACFAVCSAYTMGLVASAADLTLGNEDSLTIDYADIASIPDLENGTLQLNGDTLLLLSNCGVGDGKTYTLLTGVSALLDAEGNAIVLDSSNNAISNYFDTTLPGTDFWEDSTLVLDANGNLLLVRHNVTVKNAVMITSQREGSALYRYYAGIELKDISSSSGGAIYGGENSTIALSGNGSVEFSGNTAFDEGGAIYGYWNSTIELSGNGSVTFSGNSASSFGGAIDGGDITLSGNGSVEFSGNTAFDEGGAIYGGSNSTIELSGNDSVEFSGNTARYGGAIYGDDDSTIELSGNGSVEFSGNTARYGGAIDGSTIELSGNGSVTFSGNTASSYGGAIRGYGNLSILNNDSVLFEKNAEISGATYRLRSIYAGGSGDVISLSASAGKSIEFRDSVYIASGSTVNLNADYTDANGVVHKQTGDIIFTGAYTEQHLNELLSADGTERSALAEEILSSRTTEVYAMTNLYGGRLRVEDGAVYKGYGITAMEDSAATVLVKEGTLNHAGYDLTFHVGTTLELAGNNSISGNVMMQENSTLLLNAAETFGVTDIVGNLNIAGGVTLALSDDAAWRCENGVLLYVYGDYSGWEDAALTVTGVGTYGQADVSWVDNLLVLNYNAETFNCYFNGSAKNKQNALGLYHHYNEISFENLSSSRGGAIYTVASSPILLFSNDSVTFIGNGASSSSDDAYGGAIFGYDGSTIELSGNGSVEFIGNSASSNYDYAYGGAIYGGENSTIRLSSNGSVEFIGNSASSNYVYVYGGAIYGGYNSTIELNGNGSVTFSGNTASSSYASSGGAVYGSTIELSGNGSVEFSGNTATYYGGAIRGYGNLNIRNNDSVLFEKNAEVQNETYRLRSIYAGGSGDVISLSSAAGKSIEFRDSVYIDSGSTVELNADYTDADGLVHKQTGDIIFTGAYTEQHLNELLAADGAERMATAEEILNSRTTEVNAMTNLYGGRLRVEDGAVYMGYGITAMRDSSATVLVKDATLNHAGYDLTFQYGASLELEGNSSVYGDISMRWQSRLHMVMSETTGLDQFYVSGDLDVDGDVLISGAINLNKLGTAERAYVARIGGDYVWNASNTEEGRCAFSVIVSDRVLGVSEGLTIDEEGTFEFSVRSTDNVTWTNAAGNGLWDNRSANWADEGYRFSYVQGTDVTLGKEGEGFITLDGAIDINSIKVESASRYHLQLTEGSSLEVKESLCLEEASHLNVGTSLAVITLTNDGNLCIEGDVTVDGLVFGNGAWDVAGKLTVNGGFAASSLQSAALEAESLILTDNAAHNHIGSSVELAGVANVEGLLSVKGSFSAASLQTSGLMAVSLTLTDSTAENRIGGSLEMKGAAIVAGQLILDDSLVAESVQVGGTLQAGALQTSRLSATALTLTDSEADNYIGHEIFLNGAVAVAGSLSAGGALSGTDVTVGGALSAASLTADSLSAASLRLTDTGASNTVKEAVSVSGVVEIAGSLSAGGSLSGTAVTVGGALSAASLTADSLSAASLELTAADAANSVSGDLTADAVSLASGASLEVGGTLTAAEVLIHGSAKVLQAGAFGAETMNFVLDRAALESLNLSGGDTGTIARANTAMGSGFTATLNGGTMPVQAAAYVYDISVNGGSVQLTADYVHDGMQVWSSGKWVGQSGWTDFYIAGYDAVNGVETVDLGGDTVQGANLFIAYEDDVRSSVVKNGELEFEYVDMGGGQFELGENATMTTDVLFSKGETLVMHRNSVLNTTELTLGTLGTLVMHGNSVLNATKLTLGTLALEGGELTVKKATINAMSGTEGTLNIERRGQVTVKSDVTLTGLNNEGTLDLGKNTLTVNALVDVGGNVTAGEVAVQSRGSSMASFDELVADKVTVVNNISAGRYTDDLSVEDGSAIGELVAEMLEVRGGVVTLGRTDAATEQVLKALDLQEDAALVLNQRTALTVTDELSATEGAELRLKQQASVSYGDMNISNRGAAAQVVVNAYDLANDSIQELSHAHVAVSGDEDRSIDYKLTNSSVENTGSGKLYLTHAENTFSSISAGTGDIAVMNQALELNLDELVVGEGVSFSAYRGETELPEQEAVVSVSQSVSFGAGAHINADLKLQSGVKVEMNGPVSMGSDLYLEHGMTLGGAMLETLTSTEQGQTVVLFSGIDRLYLCGEEQTDAIALSHGISASEYFVNLISSQERSYYLVYDNELPGEGVLSIAVSGLAVPEPTSSMLGLMGLVAFTLRRRRK